MRKLAILLLLLLVPGPARTETLEAAKLEELVKLGEAAMVDFASVRATTTPRRPFADAHGLPWGDYAALVEHAERLLFLLEAPGDLARHQELAGRMEIKASRGCPEGARGERCRKGFARYRARLARERAEIQGRLDRLTPAVQALDRRYGEALRKLMAVRQRTIEAQSIVTPRGRR